MLLAYKSNFAAAGSTHIPFHIHPPFSKKRSPAVFAAIKIAQSRWMTCPRNGTAEARAADMHQHISEIGISVSESAAAEMQMIMAQFMLNNFYKSIHSEIFKLQLIKFQAMTFQHVTSACRSQPRVKNRPMAERPVKAVQRNLLYQLLKFLIRHFAGPPS